MMYSIGDTVRVERPPITGRDLECVLSIHKLTKEIFEGAVVYDLGCGNSDLGDELAIHGIHGSVIGFDRDRQVIAESEFDRTLTKKLHADLTQLPVDNESADIVLATYSLPFWASSPEEIVSFFSEACRAVKTGGLLSISPLRGLALMRNDTAKTVSERQQAVDLEVAKVRYGRWDPLTLDSIDPDILTARKV